MGQLRDRMEQDLILKGFAPTTRRNYLLYCNKFAAHYRRIPEEVGEAEIRAYLLHLIQVEQISHATYRQNLAALKFLYKVTLGLHLHARQHRAHRESDQSLGRSRAGEAATAILNHDFFSTP